MNKTNITDLLKKDILTGNSKYVKKGKVLIDKIIFRPLKDDVAIDLFYKGKHLAVVYSQNGFQEGNMFTFDLIYKAEITFDD